MFIAIQMVPVPIARPARTHHLQPFNQRLGLTGVKFRADFFQCVIKRHHWKFTTLPSVLCVWWDKACPLPHVCRSKYNWRREQSSTYQKILCVLAIMIICVPYTDVLRSPLLLSGLRRRERETLTAKRNPVSGKQEKRMLFDIAGNTKGKMGAARSFESFDFSEIMNCLF